MGVRLGTPAFGNVRPSDYDDTFGPEVRLAKHPEAGRANLPLLSGLRFVDLVKIHAATRAMAVRLVDAGDTELWSTTKKYCRTCGVA